jgi:hypothetical protein
MRADRAFGKRRARFAFTERDRRPERAHDIGTERPSARVVGLVLVQRDDAPLEGPARARLRPLAGVEAVPDALVERRVDALLDPARYRFADRRKEGQPYGPPLGMAVSRDDAYRLVVREEFIRGAYTIPSTLLGERFDSLLAAYAAMYALSIVARYKPHRWARILEGRDSPLLPVIETLMMICERWWPNLLLNRLTNSVVNFGQPTYW